ncbi:16S rRNA (guanine(1207)-N(2))-methyltransferase RsmC [Candidatus Erwinia haradaeae]|uniref:Ribosomal RNA small subunit methyltransferase C n=1 Tax=Candidatus Erwinia haradaeae TaxID=1922217 RepID=A0A451D9Y8_9GAMM|nr:16S rRNA (guanine(1207)-N(2))-methyltransferase RsmC [Candidatus Erwinia haradaeae]VFP83055.1 Ribosomal RNA small subunit methyltransferase C [Candidatus Erwinia haradaeae]
MSIFTPASNMLLRNHYKFSHRHVLFSGDLQDTLSAQIKTKTRCIYTQQYHHWMILSKILGTHAYFGVVMTPKMLHKCNTLVYYWPKNKANAQFQLQNILSLLQPGSEIFIVGEYCSGVRSAVQLIKNWVTLSKIDSARHCGLYHGYIESQPCFNPNIFWNEYLVGALKIKSLPGVFGYNGLDSGTEFLLSTLSDYHIKGRVLEIGCGTGVLSAVLASSAPEVQLTLTDVNAAAISSSQATLLCNALTGHVLPSNLYSNVIGHFDVIISNPPFHEGLKINLDMARTLIQTAPYHLRLGGELRIVANSSLPYQKMLKQVFTEYDILLSNRYFKVYRAIKTQ